MDAHYSPGSEPPPGKREATDGTWISPDRPMAEAPADPTPETIVTCNDTVRIFKRSKNRRRATKGMGWNFSFRLRSGGALHKRRTTSLPGRWKPWEGRGRGGLGAKEKIDGGSSTCVYRHDTAIMQARTCGLQENNSRAF